MDEILYSPPPPMHWGNNAVLATALKFFQPYLLHCASLSTQPGLNALKLLQPTLRPSYFRPALEAAIATSARLPLSLRNPKATSAIQTQLN